MHRSWKPFKKMGCPRVHFQLVILNTSKFRCLVIKHNTTTLIWFGLLCQGIEYTYRILEGYNKPSSWRSSSSHVGKWYFEDREGGAAKKKSSKVVLFQYGREITECPSEALIQINLLVVGGSAGCTQSYLLYAARVQLETILVVST